MKAQETFGPYLNISSELVVVDARLPTGVGLELLKENLRQTSEEIKGAKTVPTLCKMIKSIKSSWVRDDYPVLSWSEYFQKVKDDIDPLVTEDFLKIATLYLHDMGEVYFAELSGREHQVILNTKWFSYDVIGAAFASKDFPVDCPKLPECRVYNRKQLQEFFKTSADIDLLVALLQHVDLLHKCGRDKYIVPGKLPEALDKVCWRKEDEFKEYHGRRLECRQEVDMFAPDVFPCIQTRVMEELKMIDEPTAISRSTVKFASDSVEGMIQLSHDKRAINIACRCRGEQDRGACQALLDMVTRLAKTEIIKRSPGTQTEMFYLSPRSLYAHDDLEDVWYYSEDELMQAEMDGHDTVKHRATGNTDMISSILCIGYDSLFLQVFRADCSIQWVPHTVKKDLYRYLDVQTSRRNDYRSLADILGISTAKVIEKNASGSATDSIVTRFCNREGTKMSLGLFHGILSHPGLVDSIEALKILDDLLSEKGIEISQKSENIIPTDMNIHHIAWRATLHQCWDTLRTDIKPSELHPTFLSEDDEESVLAEEKAHGVRKATELLLNRLLETQGWYSDFLESLKVAGANHLVEMLKENHDDIVETLPMVKIVRERYLQAWNVVMKNQWMLFRSTVVPSTVLPHLSFLTDEDKEAILDVEEKKEEIGLSSAADILHNIVRDTSDPSCYTILIACLRENGYADLADKLCEELKNVLDGHDYKFIRVHSENLFPL
ncbi:death-associated protein kinase 1-like isoform X1 [Amphiura filiformis]|uniref:death-associated protein kinase 1-like isoform X1 n=1 Tax=Amphiura filiformis TaxID=82378 RepID=UPI003B21CE8C